MGDPRKRLFATTGVVIAFLVVLAVVLGLAYYPMWSKWLFVRLSGPGLEKHFGFRAAYLEFPDRGYRLYQLVDVDPNGILGRAGVRSGDLPVGYKHGFDSGFLGDLDWARDGHEVEFEVVARDEFDKGTQSWRSIKLVRGIGP